MYSVLFVVPCIGCCLGFLRKAYSGRCAESGEKCAAFENLGVGEKSVGFQKQRLILFVTMAIMDILNLTRFNVSPLTLIFLVDGDRILTLKRNPDKKIYPDKVSGFGGKVEPGEGLVASAQRELLEETGLTAQELSLRGMFIRILDTGYIDEVKIPAAETARHSAAGMPLTT